MSVLLFLCPTAHIGEQSQRIAFFWYEYVAGSIHFLDYTNMRVVCFILQHSFYEQFSVYFGLFHQYFVFESLYFLAMLHKLFFGVTQTLLSLYFFHQKSLLLANTVRLHKYFTWTAWKSSTFSTFLTVFYFFIIPMISDDFRSDERRWSKRIGTDGLCIGLWFIGEKLLADQSDFRLRFSSLKHSIIINVQLHEVIDYQINYFQC